MSNTYLTQFMSGLFLGTTVFLAALNAQMVRAQSSVPDFDRQLDGPESTVANFHQAIQNRNFNLLENFYCEEEKIVAQQIINLLDPDGESTSLFDAYLQITSGIYSIDVSQLYYETKYYDENLGRAVVAITGNIIINSNSGQSMVMPYRNFSFFERDWFRLINENNEWKLCHNLEGISTTSPINLSEQTDVEDGNQHVFSTNSYVDTGIAVNTGDRVVIQASGSIQFGFFAGSGGPVGIQFNPAYNYFRNLPHGQLIGRVKQPGMQDLDGWFPVGTGTEVVVQAPGLLEFAVNDNRPEDNSGSFQINFVIDSSEN